MYCKPLISVSESLLAVLLKIYVIGMLCCVAA